MTKQLHFFKNLILYFTLFFGISFHAHPNETNEKSLVLAKQAISSIQENDANGILLILDKSLIKQGVSQEQIDALIKQGKEIIDNSIFPDDSYIKFTKETVFSQSREVLHEIYHYSFPFASKEREDLIKYFLVSVIDKEAVIKLFITDYEWGKKIIEPSHTESHLEKLNLNTKDLKWFRIWYSSGYKNKECYNNANYFAVSGGLRDNTTNNKMHQEFINSIKNSNASDSEKEQVISQIQEMIAATEEKLNSLNNEFSIKDPDIMNLFNIVFESINTAHIDSLDYNYLDENTIGSPEYISLRLRFDNPEYNDFGEFKISYFISNEPHKKEIMSDYILVKHSEKTRYLILKDKTPQLVEALEKIANYNYGNYYEDNP